jgi:hypothetical protein
VGPRRRVGCVRVGLGSGGSGGRRESQRLGPPRRGRGRGGGSGRASSRRSACCRGERRGTIPHREGGGIRRLVEVRPAVTGLDEEDDVRGRRWSGRTPACPRQLGGGRPCWPGGGQPRRPDGGRPRRPGARQPRRSE